MKIEAILKPQHVVVGRRVPSKTRALDILANEVAAPDLDPSTILAALLGRESLGSTGMGEGVALPHARVRDLHSPRARLLRLAAPVDFEAIDGQPVDVILLLLLPVGCESDGLNTLACCARRLRDRALIRALRAAPDANAACAIFTRQQHVLER